MALNSLQILTLKGIHNCGNKSIIQIAENIGNDSIQTVSEFTEYLNECISKKIAGRLKESISKIEIQDAMDHADDILEKSFNDGIMALTFQDSTFPNQLLYTIDEKGKSDIPPIIFYKGNLDITSRTGIAIIGTREPTSEGLMAGEYFGRLFAEAGFNIISGLALGCDSAAHVGALKADDGQTTAFLAHGLDTIYPASNLKLSESIIDKGGILMSEYPIGTKVNRYNLVERDRLQAALASATIVIQTTSTGGTMHAAKNTLVSGKPLFCVAYSKLESEEKTTGNDLLVKQGAKLITSRTALSLVTSSIENRPAFHNHITV